MRRWTAAVLIVCAAAVCVAQAFAPVPLRVLLGALLFALVTLTVVSLLSAVSSLEAAHREQIDSESRYRAIFAAVSDAIFVWGLDDSGEPAALEEVNAAALSRLGYSRDELFRKAVDDIFAPAERGDLPRRWQQLRQSGNLVFETVQLRRDRTPLTVEVNARLVDIKGRRLCLAIARDVAARKAQEERLRGMSNRDELTGLLNRRGFFTAADDVRRHARHRGSSVLLMYVDVDGLKRVNDELGHAAGDVLIVAAANVLRLTFREGDVIARLGGDEFVALAALGRSSDERLDRETIMARLAAAVAAKHRELGDAYSFSLSAGTITAGSDDLGHIDELLARADREMYRAKRGHSGRVA